MIQVKVDEKNLKYIEKRLGSLKNEAPTVLARALNSTAKQARKSIASKAQETYTIKSGKFNNAMTIKNARKSKLQAVINSKGSPIPLSSFKVSPASAGQGSNQPTLRKAKVIKSNKLKELIIPGGESNGKDLKSFVAKFASGHIAVVQRVPGTTMKNKKKEQLRELYSISMPKMIGNNKRVMRVVRPVIYRVLKIYINKEIEKLIAKRGGS